MLHAVANALIKRSGDPLVTRGFMSAVAALCMLPLLAFVMPPAADAWPFLLASVMRCREWPSPTKGETP